MTRQPTHSGCHHASRSSLHPRRPLHPSGRMRITVIVGSAARVPSGGGGGSAAPEPWPLRPPSPERPPVRRQEEAADRPPLRRGLLARHHRIGRPRAVGRRQRIDRPRAVACLPATAGGGGSTASEPLPARPPPLEAREETTPRGPQMRRRCGCGGAFVVPW